MIMLEINDSAPNFNLLNQDGKRISLKNFKDKNVVIYFYPRANTPGCTTESCGFRDDWLGFERENISVIGISDDPVEKISQFHKIRMLQKYPKKKAKHWTVCAQN